MAKSGQRQPCYVGALPRRRADKKHVSEETVCPWNSCKSSMSCRGARLFVTTISPELGRGATRGSRGNVALPQKVLVEESLDRGVGMPPIMLANEAVLGAGIHHDVERLAEILQLAK